MRPGESLRVTPAPSQRDRPVPDAAPVLMLVGQPNCGKTTLFNALTGSTATTANYPGATVEFSEGRLPSSSGLAARVIDLPGVTTLVARSPDEEVSIRSLYGQATHPAPDLVLAVVDATQLSRHLYLARQLRDAGFPMVLVVTMADLLPRRGRMLRAAVLGERLGCPVAVVDGRSGTGLDELVARARESLAARASTAAGQPARLATISRDRVQAIYAEVEQIERLATPAVAGPRGPVDEAGTPPSVDPVTRSLDRTLLHPVLGPLCAVVILGTLFTCVFGLARPFMAAIDAACGRLADLVVALSPGSFLTRLAGDGVIRGAGAVLVFVPQIAILFFGLGLLEDSGYLARAAMLLDRPLARVGLNGRSFVPLLSGFACAIPGILAARTIPNRRERLLTIFIMPLMSCSARLPVYAILLAFLVPPDRPWIGGLAFTALYVLSAASGAVASKLATRFVPEDGRSAFILELPTYRWPAAGAALRSVARRTRHYVTRAGPTIVLMAVVLWLLTHLPGPGATGPADRADPARLEAATLESSYAARIGRTLEPVVAPLGLDWRVGTALVSAFAAREVFVSTLAIIFHASNRGGEDLTEPLVRSMRSSTRPDGSPVFTVATSLGLVVFFLFAMQCGATMAVSRREAGTWLMPAAQMVLFVGFAHAAAWCTVHALRALGVS